MAKKPNITSLSFRDLVLGADSDTLRQALEARTRIDELIVERQAAYTRIAALETEIEEVIGESGIFPFPTPPLPVAGVDAKADTLLRTPAPAVSLIKKIIDREQTAAARDQAELNPTPTREVAADESDA